MSLKVAATWNWFKIIKIKRILTSSDLLAVNNICLSVCLSVYLSVYLSLCLSVYFFIYLVCVCVCVCVCCSTVMIIFQSINIVAYLVLIISKDIYYFTTGWRCTLRLTCLWSAGAGWGGGQQWRAPSPAVAAAMAGSEAAFRYLWLVSGTFGRFQVPLAGARGRWPGFGARHCWPPPHPAPRRSETGQHQRATPPCGEIIYVLWDDQNQIVYNIDWLKYIHNHNSRTHGRTHAHTHTHTHT